jgi:hypothetical protein
MARLAERCLWRTGLGAVLSVLCLVSAHAAPQASDAAQIRSDEILNCAPGDIVTWSDGRDVAAPIKQLIFSYDSTHAPEFVSAELMRKLTRTALEAWSPCGLRLDWAEWMPALTRLPETRVIGWMSPEDDAGALIGGADLARGRLLLSPSVFTLLKANNPARLEPTLQMTLAHEIGHFLGLVAHSRRCVDVTSYYDNQRGHRCLTANVGGVVSVPGVLEYRHELPTACDIARCQRANAEPMSSIAH